MNAAYPLAASAALLVALSPGVVLAEESAPAKTVVAVAAPANDPRAARTTDDAQEDKTLLSGRVHHGGYGGPELKVSSMTGEAALLFGGQAGWIIDRHFVLGGAGYGLTTTHSPVDALSSAAGPSRISLGYGGVRLGYITEPTQLLHVSMGVILGAGGVAIVTHDVARDRWNTHDSAAFVAIEPQLEVELNVAKYVRVAPGISYRFLGDSGKPGLHASDLSGPAASLAVKFGVF